MYLLVHAFGWMLILFSIAGFVAKDYPTAFIVLVFGLCLVGTQPKKKDAQEQNECPLRAKNVPKSWEQSKPTQKQLEFIEYLGGDSRTVRTKAEASMYIESLKSEES